MKVLLGFSGGVDSAVSAELLRRAGFEVHGLYLDNSSAAERECAERAAEFMHIPLEVADVKAELEEKVCSEFAACYLRGETPNPCVICNPAVKFKNLLAAADRIGAEKIATGHYARAENGMLFKGRPSNDQSYMLCRIKREQLERCIFPLGGFEKTETRALAAEINLPVAHKPDSMEICFIPDKDYIRWLSERAEMPGEGEFIFHGESVGKHEGIYRYTVGQRRAGLIGDRKVYISRINAEDNTIELALWEELFKTEVTARSFNWLIDPPEGEIEGSVRVRHTKWETPECTARIDGELVRISCREPVRAPAAGQSAVLYQGDRVLGGGFIA